MNNCLNCGHWLQLANDGEDVCLATEDENKMCMVIPIDEDIPKWCPLLKRDKTCIDLQ